MMESKFPFSLFIFSPTLITPHSTHPHIPNHLNTTMTDIKNDYKYQPGFGNHFSSEALPDALPKGNVS